MNNGRAMGWPMTAKEIAGMVGKHRTSIVRRANKERWPFISLRTRGGVAKGFPLRSLPIDLQTTINEAMGLDAELSGNQSVDAPKRAHDRLDHAGVGVSEQLLREHDDRGPAARHPGAAVPAGAGVSGAAARPAGADAEAEELAARSERVWQQLQGLTIRQALLVLARCFEKAADHA
jgi:hypothetical protein